MLFRSGSTNTPNIGSLSSVSATVNSGVTFGSGSGVASPTSSGQWSAKFSSTNTTGAVVSNSTNDTNASLSLRTFTTEAWVRLNSMPTNVTNLQWMNIFYRGNDAANTTAYRNYSLWVNWQGYFHFAISDVNNVGYNVNSPLNLVTTNTWYHVVAKIGRAHV